MGSLDAGLGRIPRLMMVQPAPLARDPNGFKYSHANYERCDFYCLTHGFVDVMKELPATMILRPANFDTLAVRVHNLASDERLGEAAFPALVIVLVGLLPVVVLSRFIAKSRKVDGAS